MRLQNKKIAILVAEGVEDYEYFVPMMRLQEEGAKVLSAGLDLKPTKGKNGLAFTPDTLIESLNADELFALIIPGGWAPDKLRRYDAVKNLVKKMDDAEKDHWHHLSRRLHSNLGWHHQKRSARHRVNGHQRRSRQCRRCLGG